jgi:CRISPR system Cascade subunit CasE
MYLSRLVLNPTSRQVQREIGDPYNLHRTIMNAFQDRRAEDGVLHRLEIHPRSGQPLLLIQSLEEPDFTSLEGKGYLLETDPFTDLPNPAVKRFEPSLHEGQTLRFRLYANPTVKRDGKRHGLYREEDQVQWLERKGEQGGFRVLKVYPRKLGNQSGWINREENQRHRLTQLVIQFDGRLQVLDVEKLLLTIEKGIGPSKAFGCGLLSLAPG